MRSRSYAFARCLPGVCTGTQEASPAVALRLSYSCVSPRLRRKSPSMAACALRSATASPAARNSGTSHPGGEGGPQLVGCPVTHRTHSALATPTAHSHSRYSLGSFVSSSSSPDPSVSFAGACGPSPSAQPSTSAQFLRGPRHERGAELSARQPSIAVVVRAPEDLIHHLR